MTTLLQSQEARAAALKRTAPMPEGTRAAVNVVILAGGFNTRMVQEILFKLHNDTLCKDSSVTMLRGSDDTCRVPPGLFAVDRAGRHSLESVVDHLRRSHQCNPLLESLWLVTNDTDLEEFKGRGGFFDDVCAFPASWQEDRVLGNGCKRAGEWAGHVADLKIALEAIQKQNDLDTLVIGASTYLWPSFNTQKLVSNMVIRGRNTIAIQRMTRTDVGLYGPDGHTVVTCEGAVQVPQLSSVQVGKQLAPGALVARDLAYIERRSYAAVLQSPAASLPALFCELHARGRVYGAHMPWGFFELSSLRPLRYVGGLLRYSEAINKQIRVNEKRSEAHKDTIAASLREGDDIGLGRSTMIDSASLPTYLGAQMTVQFEDFDRHFFAMEANKFKGLQLPAYKLPPTFYMTTYRTQVSEAVV